MYILYLTRSTFDFRFDVFHYVSYRVSCTWFIVQHSSVTRKNLVEQTNKFIINAPRKNIQNFLSLRYRSPD